MASPNKHQQILMLSWVTAVAVRASSQVIWPDCPGMCGNVSIPYPFGTREDCSLNEDFLIFCNHSFKPPKPFWRYTNIDVIDISLLEGELRVNTYVATDCYNEKGEFAGGVDTSFSGLSTFPFSTTRNKLTTVGCDSHSEISGSNITTGCVLECDSMKSVTNGSCSGSGCCQTSIPQNLYDYNLTVWSPDNHSKIWDFNPCSYAFIVEEKSFNFTSVDLKDLQNRTEVPSVLDWAVGYQTCNEARKNSTSFACKAHSDCYDSDNGPGYRCNCSAGFRGNPYLPDGCKDIDECENTSLNDCEKQEYCHNILGNYTCSCPRGYHGDGRKEEERCTTNQADQSIANHDDQSIVIKVAAAEFLCLMFLLCVYIYIAWPAMHG